MEVTPKINWEKILLVFYVQELLSEIINRRLLVY